MQRFNSVHHAIRTVSTQTSKSLIATILTATTLTPTTLLVTGCGEADSAPQAHADSPPAPEISLGAAIVGGDDEAVYAHILAGTPINSPNVTGDTPLSLASVFGRTYAAEVLVGAGAELEIRNKSGATPLFNAAFFCHPDVVRVLIEAGADTKTTDANGTPVLQVMEMPWAQIEPVYESLYRAIGMPFDAERIESTRPKIAELLR